MEDLMSTLTIELRCRKVLWEKVLFSDLLSKCERLVNRNEGA